MTPEQWQIVVVPFPFTDGPGNKRRPAVVLSPAGFNQAAGHSILAMITSSFEAFPWPGDIPLDPAKHGLRKPCVIRMKFFTLDNRLIANLISELVPEERHLLQLFLEQLAGLRRS